MRWPLIDRLRGRFSQPGGATGAPLLDPEQLRDLALYARSLSYSLLNFQRAAAHPQLGETLSHYRGQGLEFEENRHYQPGDEPRLLNWRLYARTGALHSKVFSEERRPQLCLLLDRRAAMRFATRRQLKVTLAARIALCHVWQAQQQALPAGALLLDTEATWIEPLQGQAAIEQLVQQLNAPCPPLDFSAAQPDLGQGLRLLLQRLPEGCFVLLLSDFADLSLELARQLLPELAARHTLRAIQIVDPVERQLPRAGDFLIEGRAGQPPLPLLASDQRQQAMYAQAAERRQSALTACFEHSAIPFTRCSTEDELATCLELPHGNHGQP